ncbi:MAG: glycoside hydrolase family 3 N-terminal domain-containing protein, partial [Patescibacteria group bacterium]
RTEPSQGSNQSSILCRVTQFMNRYRIYIVALLILAVVLIYYVDFYLFDKLNNQISNNFSLPVQPVDNIYPIMDKMTIEEKVGQMFLAGIYTNDSTEILQNLIKQKEIGSVILLSPNITGKKISTVTALLQNVATTSGQPILLVTVDQEGGIVSRINYSQWELTSQTQIKNSKQAYDVAFTRGRELYNSGINVNFAPVLDYITNPSSFLYNRVFRGTKEEATLFGIAMVNGYQDAGISATVKHFPGHDDNSVDSHRTLPISQVTKENISEYIQIFQEVITKAKPLMVMTGHILFPKIDSIYPVTLSPTIIGLLRKSFGFNGVIITDDMNMGAITTKFSIEEAAKQAVIAGNDILLYVATKETIDRAYNAILNAIKNNQISKERIDSSVYRILTLKANLSKFSDSVPLGSQTVNPEI